MITKQSKRRRQRVSLKIGLYGMRVPIVIGVLCVVVVGILLIARPTSGYALQNPASLISQEVADSTTSSGTSTDTSTQNEPICTNGQTTGCVDLITKYVDPLVRLLGALVGIIVTISIVVAGIQYSSSRDDPAKVTAAKHRIYNAVIAILAYIFLFAFLQWLIPGGII